MNFKIASLAGVASLVVAAGAQAGVVGTSATVENVSAEVGTPAGLWTWRVYVNFDSADDNLLSMGFANINIVTEGATFFNVGAPFGDDFPNMGFVGFEPALAWDTWVTLDNDQEGGDTSGDPEFGLTTSSVTGGWFDSNPGTPVTAGDDLRILVAQLTLTEGAFFDGTIEAFPGAGNIGIPLTVTNIPGPASLALLGVAGLVGARRRRA